MPANPNAPKPLKCKAVGGPHNGTKLALHGKDVPEFIDFPAGVVTPACRYRFAWRNRTIPSGKRKGEVESVGTYVFEEDGTET